jgi:hypothetical protein
MMLRAWMDDATAERDKCEGCTEPDCGYCGDAQAWEEFEELEERFKRTAEAFHETHAKFWPSLEECHVELCINNRAVLRRVEEE